MNLKISNIIMSAAVLATATGCSGGAADEGKIIEKPEFKSENGIFGIEALEALGRVSEPVVSPDKSKILFGISYESVEENKSNRDLYVMNIDGSDQQRITATAKSENNAVWIEGGKRIAFLYPDGDNNQVWVMNADGSGRKCVSSLEKGVDGFVLSPDEKHIVMISTVKFSRKADDVYPDLPKASGRIIDDLMYKHWDEWITDIPHPFLGSFNGNEITDVTDIMADEPFEAPMKPFNGIESFAWSPDSQKLIYVSRKKKGKDYALSTNSNLYLYDLASKEVTNLTEGMNGYDTNPVYSPDGTKVAWLSMANDGYESDKNRIFMLDFATGEKTDLTADWDYTADDIAWNPSGKSIYFIAPYLGVTPVFSLDIATHEVTTVADGVCDYASLAPVDENTLITMQHSMLAPNEIYSVNAGKLTALTTVNADVFAQVTMPTVEKVMVPTTDGKEMLTWVILPPNFDKTKKYPAILYCQGGPQQAVSQFWSYRWNFAIMASQGYVVIAPNRRGVPGFGTEWEAQISKDYGGQNMRDYLSAVDYMKANADYINPEKIGAVGASYGGFSVYWLAGNHDHRFACFIAHAGIFNAEAQYLETEEMWFENWDQGGAFWDKNNAVAMKSFAASPHRFVDKWDTPILVTHGELDFRILASQGQQAFNAAVLRGIPAEMLIFPDENHWILKPQNAVLWQRVFFRWLDRWLKDKPNTADTNNTADVK
jgi:dipeptidyl aminopeptidase/acylaminoacyl peptidase